MNLSRMKASILKRAKEWDGVFDIWDMLKRGDRYGRISKRDRDYNARLYAALDELTREGHLAPEGMRWWRLKV